MKIAFLGTGLMGSGFVRRLLAQGHTVHVWNRSPASAKALEAHGAKASAASDDAGVMLVSGDPEQCAVVLPELARMTGKVFQLGLL